MRIFIYISVFFVLQPYIGISVFPSDLQPFALLSSLILSLIFLKYNEFKAPQYCIPLIIISAFSLASFFGQILFIQDGDKFLDLFRYLVGYLTPIFVVLNIYFISKYIPIKRVIINISDVIVGITILGYILNIFNLSYVIQLFVNRSIFDEIGVRGLSSFYPEQSRISEQMSILFFVYLLFGGLNIKRVIILFTVSLLSFSGQFFVQLFFLFVSFLIAYFITAIIRNKVSVRSLYISIPLLMSFILVIYYFPEIADLLVQVGVPSRGLLAISVIIEHGLTFLSDDHGFLIKSSGVITSISALIVNPFNFQMGAFSNLEYTENIIDVYYVIQEYVFNNDYPVIANRVGSALGLWSVDFGLIGFLLSLIVISKMYIRSSLKNSRYMMYYFWAAIFLTIMFFVKIPLANPSLWALYTIVISKRVNV